MKNKLLVLGLTTPLTVLFTGCATLLTTSDTQTKSAWNSIDEAQRAFGDIAPGESTLSELKCLGFDPYASPNFKVLNYLDVMDRFLMNPSIKRNELPAEVQDALAAREECHGYEVDLSNIRNKRYGNAFLDITGFRRKTRETGWRYKALFVLKGDVVVYKLWSGEPNVEKYVDTKRPLGPFQELDHALTGMASHIY